MAELKSIKSLKTVAKLWLLAWLTTINLWEFPKAKLLFLFLLSLFRSTSRSLSQFWPCANHVGIEEKKTDKISLGFICCEKKITVIDLSGLKNASNEVWIKSGVYEKRNYLECLHFTELLRYISVQLPRDSSKQIEMLTTQSSITQPTKPNQPFKSFLIHRKIIDKFFEIFSQHLKDNSQDFFFLRRFWFHLFIISSVLWFRLFFFTVEVNVRERRAKCLQKNDHKWERRSRKKIMQVSDSFEVFPALHCLYLNLIISQLPDFFKCDIAVCHCLEVHLKEMFVYDAVSNFNFKLPTIFTAAIHARPVHRCILRLFVELSFLFCCRYFYSSRLKHSKKYMWSKFAGWWILRWKAIEFQWQGFWGFWWNYKQIRIKTHFKIFWTPQS